MAGLLYLFRLFVYHSNETNSFVKERFHIMETRLYKLITVPAMLGSLGFGGGMLYLHPPLLGERWMQVKLFCVFLLIGCTHYGKALIRKFREGRVTQTHTYFRVLNELPTLLMIIIVGMVIMRPF